MASDEDVDMEDPVASSVHDAMAGAGDLGPRSIVVDQFTPPPWPMLSQYLLQIIEEHFGQLAHMVATQLLNHGDRITSLRQTVIAIRENPANKQITPDQVKAVLKALIQHSIVYAIPIPNSDTGEFGYSVNQKEVQGLVRFAKYVLLLQHKDGVWFDAGTIIESFADKGRLKEDVVVQLAVEKEIALGGTGGEDSENRLSKAFSELAKHGFITKCDVGKFVEQFNEVGNVTQNHGMDDLWWVNHDRFILEFRNNLIQEYVTCRIDATAAKIVRTMTEHKVGTSVELKKQQEFSEIALFDSLPRQHITRQALRHCIDEMLNDSVPIIRYREAFGSGDVMYVDIPGLIAEAKVRRVQSILRAKYDSHAARLFRFLATSRYLEEKMITEKALLPEKKVREILLRLMNDNFVHLQEIPKSADRNPRRTFYLWSTDLSKVYSGAIGSFYMTWLKLKSRLASEVANEARLTAKVAKHGKLSAEFFTEAEMQRWAAHEKATQRIETALMKLDDSIMLFTNF